MSRSRERLGLLLGFIGMCLFAGTLPATRLAVTGFDPVCADLVVTGEGAVDATTWQGKAPGEVVRRCRDADVRWHLFSARDDLSGDPARAEEDLFELGERLAAS